MEGIGIHIRFMPKDTTKAREKELQDLKKLSSSAIQRWVAQDLNRKTIPQEVWANVVERNFVSQFYADEPDADTDNYDALKNEVAHLLSMFQKGERAAHRKKKGRKLPRRRLGARYSISENVRLMTKALYDSEDPTIDAIFCTLESGHIVLEAAPWVPAGSIERAYREVQQFVLGGARNETVQDSTLERYNWVRNRRSTRKESWEETKKAWEKGGGKKSPSARQFCRDFHRTTRFLDRIEALRDKAEQQEYEGGALARGLKAVRIPGAAKR